MRDIFVQHNGGLHRTERAGGGYFRFEPDIDDWIWKRYKCGITKNDGLYAGDDGSGEANRIQRW